MQVTLRDRTFSAKTYSGIKILPLAKAMGISEMFADNPEGMKSLADLPPEKQQEMAMAIVRSLGEPANHHRVAYSLKQLIPDLPTDMVDYRIEIREDGTRQEHVVLDLESEELLAILSQVQQPPAPPKVERPKPQGFAAQPPATAPAAPKINVEKLTPEALEYLQEIGAIAL